jgi:hypothetical protein
MHRGRWVKSDRSFLAGVPFIERISFTNRKGAKPKLGSQS